MVQKLVLFTKACSSAGVNQFSISLAPVRPSWFAHAADLASVPGPYYFTADNECSMLWCYACFSYPCLKLQCYWPESIFPLLNFQSGHKSFLRCWTPHDAFSLCGNSSAVPRGGVILTYGIEIPCGTDSYSVRLRSFSHLPPDPVLGCFSITPPPWGRNPQPTLL